MKKYIFPLLVAINAIAHATNDDALTFLNRESRNEPKISERLNNVWEGVDPSLAFNTLEQLLKEEFDHRIDRCKVKSKCIITNSVPIYFHNLSDYHILVQTEEPQDGITVPIVRVVEAYSRSVFYSNFNKSSFVISTQTKDARDKDLMHFEGAKKGMQYTTAGLTKDHAQKEAVLTLSELKAKRAAASATRLKFKAADFFPSLDESIENAGLALIAENDVELSGQITLSLHRLMEWGTEYVGGPKFQADGALAKRKDRHVGSLVISADLAIALYKHYSLINCCTKQTPPAFSEIFPSGSDEDRLFKGYQLVSSFVSDELCVSASKRYEKAGLDQIEQRVEDARSWFKTKKRINLSPFGKKGIRKHPCSGSGCCWRRRGARVA